MVELTICWETKNRLSDIQVHGRVVSEKISKEAEAMSITEEQPLTQPRKLSDLNCMRPPEAANYIGLSESTLAKLRMKHKREAGPKFIKCGGAIIYRKSDLDTWLEDLIVECQASQYSSQEV